jgi:hypothetical protein
LFKTTDLLYVQFIAVDFSQRINNGKEVRALAKIRGIFAKARFFAHLTVDFIQRQ